MPHHLFQCESIIQCWTDIQFWVFIITYPCFFNPSIAVYAFGFCWYSLSRWKTCYGLEQSSFSPPLYFKVPSKDSFVYSAALFCAFLLGINDFSNESSVQREDITQTEQKKNYIEAWAIKNNIATKQNTTALTSSITLLQELSTECKKMAHCHWSAFILILLSAGSKCYSCKCFLLPQLAPW